ncbi:MAG: hypothetical protein IJO71_09330 [Microbacterium sp.]|uniref:hypothetical protein n=1 Tax=Microbacterium sp. TaxID=51671 RepID=UPI0025E903B9|nr:hypothetical protein [Microbacterium sp.]MBQ9917382.1 hypothetical protein [Microbacterium sp.]
MTELVREILVLPDGMAEDDINLHSWALSVKWRGIFNGRSGGGYSVSHYSRELSRAGKWGYPQPFQRWQYRFETIDEAVRAARAVIETVKVGGHTFADWGPRNRKEYA